MPYWQSLWAGILFGAWPFVMKASGLKQPMMAAFILTAVSLAVYLPFLKTAFDQTTFVGVGIIFALVAGVMNGVGTIAFQQIIGSKEIEITTGVFLLILTQIVVTAVGGWLINGDPFTWKKASGVILVLVAAKLLTGK